MEHIPRAAMEGCSFVGDWNMISLYATSIARFYARTLDSGH